MSEPGFILIFFVVGMVGGLALALVLIWAADRSVRYEPKRRKNEEKKKGEPS